MDKQFVDKMDRRFDKMDARLDTIDADLRRFYTITGEHEGRLQSLERRDR